VQVASYVGAMFELQKELRTEDSPGSPLSTSLLQGAEAVMEAMDLIIDTIIARTDAQAVHQPPGDE
jgi:hypothetical protein